MTPLGKPPKKRQYQSWSLKKVVLPNLTLAVREETSQMSYIEIDFNGRKHSGRLKLSQAGIRWNGGKPLDWDQIIAELFLKEKAQ